VIVHLEVLLQYRSVTDTHTHTDGHTTTAYTALSIASRGKKAEKIALTAVYKNHNKTTYSEAKNENIKTTDEEEHQGLFRKYKLHNPATGILRRVL